MNGLRQLLWSTMLLLVSVLVIGCFSGSHSKNTATPVILKLGTETAIDSPETKGAQKLAELVKEKSRGTLVIEIYENARLGTMRERNEGMRMGTIDMGTSSVGFLSNYDSVLGIFDLPYLYKDKTHELRVFDGELGRAVDRNLQTHGLKVICYFDAGARHMTNNIRPINVPADIKGLRIRVPQSEASIATFKAFGAVPTPMAFGEVYTALQQNVVVGQENPAFLVLHNKFYEVQKYLSLTNHQLFIQVLLIGEKSWQKLSTEHQKIMLEAAQEAQSYQRELALREEGEALIALKEKGMVVNEVANDEAFALATQEIRENYIKRLGQPAKELFEKIDVLR